MPTSHLEATIASRSHLIHEVYAKDRTDKMAYYFIMIEEHKQNLFMKALESPPVDLSEFGLILASGYGDVNDEVKQHLLTKYCYKVKGK